MRSPLARFTLSLAFALVPSFPAVAQTAQTAAPTTTQTPTQNSAETASRNKDQAELEHYSLTVDAMTRFGQTAQDLKILTRAHPETMTKLEPGSNDTLSSSERRLSSDPSIVAVLAKHAFAPHEFVLFELALFQAALVSATASQNGSDPAQIAAQTHINPANLVFLQQHKTEFEALSRDLQDQHD